MKRRAIIDDEDQGGGSPAGGAGMSVAKDEEVIDGLKRWLERKDSTFLEWLEEGDAEWKQVCHAPAEVEALQSTLNKYEEELNRLRKRLVPQEGISASEIETDEKLGVELSDRVDVLIEERNALKSENIRLQELYEEQKAEFQRSMEGLTEDKSSLIIKEMEIKEMESRLKAQQQDIESRSTGVKMRAVKDLEKDISDRFSVEIKDKEERWKHREAELRSQIDRLEKELTRMTVDLRIKEDQTKLGNLGSPEATQQIERKLADLQSREKESLMLKVQQENLRAELSVREEEVNRLRDAINKKEEEMARREEEQAYREKILAAERNRFEDSKKELVGVEQAEMKKRLEDLTNEIKSKEGELRAKEKWLTAKAEEIRLRESGVIDDELRTRQKEQLVEFQQMKAKTGNNRLDDLLYGGIPFGSNIMVHGPSFIGKEVMVNGFIADGLKKGVPCLWVITDKRPFDIREEMHFVMSGYEEYEKKGLVRYIDSFSRSMGDDSQDPYTIYIDEPTNHEAISEKVEQVCKEYKEKYKYYRLAFRSVSTLIAYSDPNAAFRLLSPMCGRRKKDQAVAMFVVEKGMHGEQEIQMLGSIMDGMFDFKVDQMKSWFSVQGISDVQSRSYIRYTATKHSLNIGSFALDHIR